MVVHKRKKNIRQRAGTTHGYGSMKKHRGAGSRGGRGNAGSGKRGDAKKPSFWKDTKYLGKYGFTPRFNELKVINLKEIDDNAESWVVKGLIGKKAEVYNIDLTKLGYDKLLGNGQVTKKLNINVAYATSKAIEKVNQSGGSIVSPVISEPEKSE